MLTACGIETVLNFNYLVSLFLVATVLTACGIETSLARDPFKSLVFLVLQQCLPLAVLKLYDTIDGFTSFHKLQQCLPLAVLKRESYETRVLSASM